MRRDGGRNLEGINGRLKGGGGREGEKDGLKSCGKNWWRVEETNVGSKMDS